MIRLRQNSKKNKNSKKSQKLEKKNGMSVVDQAYVRKISELEQSNENLQSYVKRLEVQLQEYQLEMPEFQSNVEDQKETESDRPLPVRSIDLSPYTIHEFT